MGIFVYIPFIILAVAALLASTGKEGFQLQDARSYEAPRASITLLQSQQDEVEAGAKQACIDLGRRIGEAMAASNKLIDIKKQINDGVVSLEEARRKLAYMGTLPNFNCGSEQQLLTLHAGQTLSGGSEYCNDFTDKLIYLNQQLNPSDKSLKDYTTINGINNYINNEFQKVREYFRIIQTLSISLRCDKLI
jgi:hypothetical protein